ncbi:MAG: WYL domain-containing protein [Actinobacteria bacterium]|nr:WYL domain-containing protein [Actinomycetota bacterium]
MSTQKVRQPGQSKDTDKLIRRLSLVALLLSRGGQPVSAAEIRSRVEGYPTMTEEAFKRRFFEDRDELRRLGIEIRSHEDPLAETATEAYSLPADAYYLEPVALDGDELAALAACLAVLEDRFAYSQPLRLALLSLAQGRPELVTEAEAPPLTVLPEAHGPVAALPKLQAAVAERKTVTFSYYAITTDTESERIVDPYGLQLVAGEWYLIGWCHLREAVRTFRLSRIRSQVRFHTRRPHDFSPPDDFDLDAYRDRPAWQLAEPRGSARVRVSPAMAWWVEAHWAHCGRVDHEDDGSIVYETPYADARPLLGWVLGLADEAELVEPAELRAQLRAQLDGLAELLDAPAPPRPTAARSTERPRPARPRRRRPATDDLRVEVDRFTRLTALASYLMRACNEDQAVLDVATVRSDLGVTAKQLRDDVALLNMVNFGGDGLLLYAEFTGRGKLEVSCELAGPTLARPARLSPLQADTLLLAIELVGAHLPTATGAALASAADKIRAVRGGAPALAGGDLLLPADEILRDVNRSIVERRLLRIEYWTEGTDVVKERVVEPYLLVHSRGEWYYVCWCRTAGGTRVFRVATTKSARLLQETFEPRGDVELDLYRREGVPASGAYAPKAATVWFSPVVARWIAERQPVEPLHDGSCLASQPYVDVRWLASHLLRLGAEARPLEPPEAVEGVRAVVDRLRETYA